MNKETQIVWLPIKKLVPYEHNAKEHTPKQIDNIKKSLTDYGWQNPCLITKDNVLIAGHGRVMAAKELGITEVPCIYADDLTEEQIKEYRHLDNLLSEGGYIESELKYELQTVDLSGYDFSEIDVEIQGVNVPEDNEPLEVIEDEIPEKAETRCKTGDLWQLGEHRLICGDSTDKANIDKLMNGTKADMVFTDMPYGMNLDTDYSGMQNHLDFAKEKGFTGGKKYEQGKVDEFNPEMINAVLSLNANECFLWGADYFAELLPNKNDGSWIVWDKRANNTDDIEADYQSDKMYGSCFELCWSKRKHKRDIARVKWAGVFGTEQEFDHKRYHPTQKPIRLAEWFLSKYSKANDLIVDLFGGSGSTLIACEQTNRRCYMCELDEHYCDVIIQRWENLTGNKAVLINE